MTVPVSNTQSVLTLERGSALVDITAEPRSATVQFERVEKAEGPPDRAVTGADPISDQRFSVTGAQGLPSATVLQGKTVAPEAAARRVRERVFDAFETDPFTQALHQGPVAGGRPRPDLATAFVRAFAARDAVRGGPPLRAQSAALSLKAFNGDVAVFDVSAVFTSADPSMNMRATLDGELVVDQRSGQLLRQILSGPIELLATGRPGPTSGQWSETLTREPLADSDPHSPTR